MTYEVLVLGQSLAGMSIASQAHRSGIKSVLVVGSTRVDSPSDPGQVDHIRVEKVESVKRIGWRDGCIEMHSTRGQHSARNVVIDLVAANPHRDVPWSIPKEVAHRFHRDVDFDPQEQDVLLVGRGDSVVMQAAHLVESRARVVLAFDGDVAGISMLGRQMLERLERLQLATILWRSWPETIWGIGGFPMVSFGDRRTPDLQFDHVVAVIPDEVPALPFPVDLDHDQSDGLFVVTESGRHVGPGVPVTPGSGWAEMQERRFPNEATSFPRPVAKMFSDRVRGLQATQYNATITSFDTAHNELWRIKLRPDRESIAYRPGQYCSIGLGYWEARADEVIDERLDTKLDKLIRRSYSISSPLLDEFGYLSDPSANGEIELYIVWVRPDAERIPALTPRLALKNAGDRLYLSPKVAGRYTVRGVTDPSDSVVFVATGTGEAPHNAMLLELLRKGHHGRILSLVSVRYLADLAYKSEHRELEERYSNYTYLAVPTREPGQPRRYVQDLLEDGSIDDALGAPLNPASSHVFLCGNPAMIGIPRSESRDFNFPETVGMIELLQKRGFTLDRRKVPGNVHYEEYW